MSDIDTSTWSPVGGTCNTDYFLVSDCLLAAVPHQGSRDDAASALENITFQNDFWDGRGSGGVVAVFFDRMVSQDKGARGVYQEKAHLGRIWGTALIGGTMLSRAMISFFLGLARPRLPIKPFHDIEGALAWAEKLSSKHTTTEIS